MDSLDGFVSDDHLAIGPLREVGWEVSFVSWRDPAPQWDRFESVVIRTPWDYQSDPDSFIRTLETIEAAGPRLENPLPLVRWNLDKRYLRELEAKGIRTVPTIYDSGMPNRTAFDEWMSRFGVDELIIKPTVSATAQDTFRLKHWDPDISSVFSNRSFMIQPFLNGIVEEGEYSLFYFNGRYSHTILKAPELGDFRVQEEHGGAISRAEPESRMLAAAEAINRIVSPVPLYTRIDLVRERDGGFALMELELIEPALYLRMDTEAPTRFAREFARRMNEL